MSRCITSPCDLSQPEAVLYKGECRDVMEDAVCGQEAVGQRIYMGEDGLGYCDCQEGWLRYEGRCYQEFTPAFCLGRDQILTFQPPSSQTVFPGEGKKLYIEGLKHNFSCQRNPCEPSYLPHT